MKLKPKTTFLVSTLFVVVGIAVTVATGLWQTSSDKVPRKLSVETNQTEVQTSQTDATQAIVADGAVQYDPADIRGSYTFGEISNLYGVPLADLAKAFQLTDAEVEAFQVKTMKERFADAEQELGTASLRLFVASYLGLPYEPTEETWLPQNAVDVLMANGKMLAEQVTYIGAHTIQ